MTQRCCYLPLSLSFFLERYHILVPPTKLMMLYNPASLPTWYSIQLVEISIIPQRIQNNLFYLF
jgi:hypothetical protein